MIYTDYLPVKEKIQRKYKKGRKDRVLYLQCVPVKCFGGLGLLLKTRMYTNMLDGGVLWYTGCV